MYVSIDWTYNKILINIKSHWLDIKWIDSLFSKIKYYSDFLENPKIGNTACCLIKMQKIIWKVDKVIFIQIETVHNSRTQDKLKSFTFVGIQQ